MYTNAERALASFVSSGLAYPGEIWWVEKFNRLVWLCNVGENSLMIKLKKNETRVNEGVRRSKRLIGLKGIFPSRHVGILRRVVTACIPSELLR